MSIEGRLRKVDLCTPSPTVPPMPLSKISRSGCFFCSPGRGCRVRVRQLALTDVPLPSGSFVSRGGSCGKRLSSTRDDDQGRVELHESEESSRKRGLEYAPLRRVRRAGAEWLLLPAVSTSPATYNLLTPKPDFHAVLGAVYAGP